MANTNDAYVAEVMEQKKALGIHCPAITSYDIVLEEPKMKLFFVSAKYTPKGCQKSRGYTGYAIAETEEEAIEKFKSHLPASLESMPRREYSVRYSAMECSSGVSVHAITR